MLDLFCTIRHCHVQGVLFQVYFSIFSGGRSAVSMVSNCRMSPKIWQRSSLIWILPNYPVLHKYKWKRIQVQIQLQVKFKPQIQAKITRKQYIWQLVVIAIFYPPELSSAVLWTNPSFTAAVRLNLIWDSCILKVFPSIASYVVNGDKWKAILSTTLVMEKVVAKK